MFSPENEMERVLMLASTDPAAGPQFYKEFANSEICVPEYSFGNSQREGESKLKAGTDLVFLPTMRGGKEFLPIFSALSRLQIFIPEDARYMRIQTVEFLKLTQGAALVLNPGSEYGKEFTPSEVQSILNGWKPAKIWVAEKETPIKLGQPTRYPHALTEALSRLFGTMKNVESAYLAQFYNPALDDPPHTLIGIKAICDWDTVISQVLIVIGRVEIPDPPVDILKMDGTDGPEGYLLTTKPFYKRKIFGLF